MNGEKIEAPPTGEVPLLLRLQKIFMLCMQHDSVHFYTTNVPFLMHFTVHCKTTLKKQNNSGVPAIITAGQKGQKSGCPAKSGIGANPKSECSNDDTRTSTFGR